MKKPMAPTLSAHLLQEARKFSFSYPDTVRRTKRNLEFQVRYDRLVRMFTEWRKTFAPHEVDDSVGFFNPLWVHDTLDEYYCRDLLKDVPSFVKRTLKLKHLVLSGIPPSQHVYLAQAANCYIYGLSQAAVALARAAMEESLRTRLREDVAAKLELKDVIEYLHRTKGLSGDGRTRADKVRIAGNKVLHGEAAGAPDGLAAIENARAVILEVSQAPHVPS